MLWIVIYQFLITRETYSKKESSLDYLSNYITDNVLPGNKLIPFPTEASTYP